MIHFFRVVNASAKQQTIPFAYFYFLHLTELYLTIKALYHNKNDIWQKSMLKKKVNINLKIIGLKFPLSDFKQRLKITNSARTIVWLGPNSTYSKYNEFWCESPYLFEWSQQLNTKTDTHAAIKHSRTEFRLRVAITEVPCVFLQTLSDEALSWLYIHVTGLI